MAEYIEREALTKELNSKSVVHQMDNERFHYKQGYLTGLIKADIIAKTLPTADVVEVVRCRDCAVPHNKWTGCPKLNGLIPPPDFYCAYGERSNNNA